MTKILLLYLFLVLLKLNVINCMTAKYTVTGVSQKLFRLLLIQRFDLNRKKSDSFLSEIISSVVQLSICNFRMTLTNKYKFDLEGEQFENVRPICYLCVSSEMNTARQDTNSNKMLTNSKAYPLLFILFQILSITSRMCILNNGI